MSDAGYIAAGFLVTFVVIVGYLLSLRGRLVQAERLHLADLASLGRDQR